jgi:hypothetical protein
MRQETTEDTYYIVKNDNFDALKKFGFIKDKRAAYPTQLIRKINDTTKLKVCDDMPRSYNMWSHTDWKNVGIMYLEEDFDDRRYGTRNIEKITPYMQDLIESEIVELAK